MAMVRFFSNLRLLRNPNSAQCIPSRIRNLSFDQCNGNSEELTQKPHENFPHYAKENPQIHISRVHEVATEVSRFIQTRPGWEQMLLNEFPSLDFTDSVVYNAVLKQQCDLTLSLRFYSWLKSFNGSRIDPDSYNALFCRLLDSISANAAKTFLDEEKCESCIRFLCENGLIDESLVVFEWLKSIGHNVSLETWNLALSHSVRTERIDVVWILYGHMTECGIAMDVKALGHLIQAFCLENNAAKGYELLQQVLAAGHTPDRVVFNSLVSAFSRIGNFERVSDILYSMIAKNCKPDIFTYKELVICLCKGARKDEGFRIFNELRDRGYVPDTSMYTSVIRALFWKKNWDGAQKLWNEMIESGMAPDEHAYAVFIEGLFQNGSVDEAMKLYETLVSEGYTDSVVIRATVIRWLCSIGKVEEARSIFDSMNEKGITYNLMLIGYLQKGDVDEGIRFLKDHGFMPTITAFKMLIKKLREMGREKEVETIWMDMRDRQSDERTLDSTADGLSKQRSFGEATQRSASLKILHETSK